MFVFLKPPGRSVRPPGRPRGSRGASKRSWGAQLGPPWGPAGPPGVLLERSWRPSRHRGHSRGRFWQSPGALLVLLEPRDLILDPFFPPERLFVLAFCATATEIATASWSLALEALNQGSWALALESWALARGSLALARDSWALALGSWLVTLGSWAVSLALGLQLCGLGL